MPDTTRRRPTIDLTVAALPVYVGTMWAEDRWLERNRSQHPEMERGRYERRDTRTDLTMALASVLVPLVTDRLRPKLAVGGSGGRALAGLVLLGSGTAVVADRRARRRRARRDNATGATPADGLERVAGIGAAVGICSAVTLSAATWGCLTSPERLWERRRLDLGSGAAAWGLALVGWDFIYYWNHRFMHETRFLWAIHVVHHSSEHYNLAVALRQPVADMLGIFVPQGLLALAGVDPRIIGHSRSINLLYQYWIHTETIRSIGPAQGILNSPADHRVHHGTAPASIDRNHGGILSIWDRLFGTYQTEDEPQVYGLTTNLDSFSPWKVAFHEYRDIVEDIITSRTWPERLSVVFRGPGYAIERRRARRASQQRSVHA